MLSNESVVGEAVSHERLTCGKGRLWSWTDNRSTPTNAGGTRSSSKNTLFFSSSDRSNTDFVWGFVDLPNIARYCSREEALPFTVSFFLPKQSRSMVGDEVHRPRILLDYSCSRWQPRHPLLYSTIPTPKHFPILSSLLIVNEEAGKR